MEIMLCGLAVVFVVFWVSQFIQLMLLSDEDFPGKNDKILWFVTFILLSVIAPGLFAWWKQAYLHERKLDKPSDQ